MPYARRRYGFETLRVVAAAGDRIFAPGAALGVVAAGTNLRTRPGTIHAILVELPDSQLAPNNIIELYDLANVNLIVPVPAPVPVMVLRPFAAAATDPSFVIPVHRHFHNGMIVRSNPHTANSDYNVIWAPAGHSDFRQRF